MGSLWNSKNSLIRSWGVPKYIGLRPVKELSSLTFIIENESCYVVSNNNLSEAQIEILNNLRIHDKDKSMFGIITFNTDTNNYTLAYNGETVSFDKLLEYMEALKNKYKKI